MGNRTFRNTAFLESLQKEAALQAKLETHRLLPSSLDAVTSFVGRYSWQVILFLSGMLALGVELW